MAREHARLWLDINADDDFESLPFDAQGLYARVILTLDDLSYCGVACWRPRKLTTKAPDLTVERIAAAAHYLEAGRFCLFDLDTEEVLARSFIRRDELLRNPKFAAAVVKAYAGIASKPLRAAVVDEVRRVRDEHPEYSSWGHKDIGAALSKLMGKDGSAEVPYVPQFPAPEGAEITNRIGNRISNRIGNADPVQIGNPVGNRIGNGITNGIPSTYTSTSTPAPLEGYSGTEGHQGAEPDPTPPRPPDRCTKHANIATPPACRACATARHKAEAWDATHRAAAEARRQAFLAEVAACEDCDEHGWTLADDGTPAEPATRCTRHTWAVAHA